MVRKARRNVGEQEYVPRNAAAALLVAAAWVVWFALRVPRAGPIGLSLAGLAAYLFLTARKEWDPVYALLRVRTTPKPL